MRLVAGVAILVALAVAAPAAAQPQTDVRLTTAAGQRVRSTPFEVRQGDVVRIALAASTGSPLVNVYVHDAAGTLVGRDDPDAVTGAITWQATRSGSYFVVVHNTGTGTADLRITVEASRGGAPAGDPGFAVVGVLYATNRQEVRTGAQTAYGTEPSPDLLYGSADVSIPRDHRLGELEGPSILRLERRPDPARHVTVLTLRGASEQAFLNRLNGRVAASARHEVLLFVHGFNVTFDDALRRTAQLAYDLAFDGPAIAFSWPSQGSPLPLAYTRDQRNADVSALQLARLLQTLRGSGNTTLHIVAHSMGGRVLAAAMEQLDRAGQLKNATLGQMAFLAPDIDAELFRNAAARITAAATRVTLYASSNDTALALARRVSGYPRAGEAGPGIVVVSGLQTIDASDVDTSALGLSHSYFADNSTVLSDLFGLLRGRSPDERFGLTPVRTSGGTYWRFKPAVR